MTTFKYPTKYTVVCAGSDYCNYRFGIVLHSDTEFLGNVSFHDEGVPADEESPNGTLRMHLPTSAFHDVLDVLRNEKPIYFYFQNGHAFLSTSKEPAGEGE